jgi:drug/metabolite transporter (DMT)-like permease
MSNTAKGYIAAALGAAAYGLNPLFSLPLYEIGFSPMNVLFYRFFIAAVIVGVMFKCQGGNLLPAKQEIWPLFSGALMMIISSITLFYSYKYVDSGVASTLLFVYPIAVAAVMTCFFKEKLKLGTVLGIALAVPGVVILSLSDSGQPVRWEGVVLALASALSYAIYIVMVRVTGLHNIPAEKISFYTLSIGAVIFLAFFDFSKNFPLPATLTGWGCVILLALLPAVAAFVLTTKAIHLAGATPTAIFGGLEPVVAVICGIVVFHEPFGFTTAAGVLLVIISVIIVILSNSSRKSPAQ